MSDRGPPTVPRATPGAIDRAVLGEWLGDDNPAIDALLVEFGDSVRAEHDVMLEALIRDDMAAFGLAVHRLRGAALSMGANGLARAAAIMDTAARANDIAACRAGMPDLDVQLRLTVAEVPPRD